MLCFEILIDSCKCLKWPIMATGGLLESQKMITCLLQELKFPPRGVETNPSSWPWFYRMNDAIEGRLANAAPVLAPIVEDGDEECEPLLQTPRKRARRSRGGMAEFLTESEMDLLVDNEEKNGTSALGDLHRGGEFTYKCKEEQKPGGAFYQVVFLWMGSLR